MKAENTLQIMMDFHGSLFYTRQKCLDHLFLTIGNGYEWKNGELVEKDEDVRLKRYVLIKDIKHAEPDEMIKQLGMFKESLESKLESSENRQKYTWYPLCKDYSYICNYPKDIKPDWKALINECKAMLKEDGIEVPENRPYIYPSEK